MSLLSQPPTLAGYQCQFLQMHESTHSLRPLIDILLLVCEGGDLLSDHFSSCL